MSNVLPDEQKSCKRMEFDQGAITFERNHKLGLSTPIFRYLSKERYLEMIEGKANTFSHLSLWEDPYEGFLFRAMISIANKKGDEDEERSLYEMYKFVYGQSWTFNGKESDILWRANGKRGEVVRIATTIEKLKYSILTAGKMSGKDNSVARIRIGEVEYEKQSYFDNLISNIDVEQFEFGDDSLDPLFKKREAFKDEQELRVIIIPQCADCLDMESDKNGSLLKLKITESLIDEVLLDPCMSPQEVEQIKCRTLYRFPELKVWQSTLYKWPGTLASEYGTISRGRQCIPGIERLLRYLADKDERNAGSILSRIRRVLRVLGYQTLPTLEMCRDVYHRIDQLVENLGSAQDCKTAWRFYVNALYGENTL